MLSVTYVRDLWEPQDLPQPKQRGRVIANDEIYMGYSAVQFVDLEGPFEINRIAEDTPSRAEIFVCHPDLGTEEEACATEILAGLARRAYRRPATDVEVQTLLEFYSTGREDGAALKRGFNSRWKDCLYPRRSCCASIGIRKDWAPGEIYRLSDLELASRLSFFLWSSIPDERLLDLAESGQPHGSDDPGAGSAANVGGPSIRGCDRARFRCPVVEFCAG